jgi:hypothetical protein
LTVILAAYFWSENKFSFLKALVLKTQELFLLRTHVYLNKEY